MNKTEVFANYQQIVDACKGDEDLANNVVLRLVSSEYDDEEHISYEATQECIRYFTSPLKKKEYEKPEVNVCKNCDCMSCIEEEQEYTKEDVLNAINALPPQYRDILHKIFIGNETVDDISDEYEMPVPIIILAFRDGTSKLTEKLDRSEVLKKASSMDMLDRYFRRRREAAESMSLKELEKLLYQFKLL